MKSDEKNQAKSDLLRELESLRAQLDDPDAAELREEDIPLLLDKVEKVVAVDTNEFADEDLSPEEIAALQAAYRDATTDLEDTENRLVEDAFQRLKEDREAIERVTGDGWQSSPNTSGLPGQQPLFQEPAGDSAIEGADRQQQDEPVKPKAAPAITPRPAALGENPFLPKHIRDRLQERRRMLEDDIAQAASFFPARAHDKTAAASGDAEPEYQALVDELVTEYLPRIEAELRRRLARVLQEKSTKPRRRDD